MNSRHGAPCLIASTQPLAILNIIQWFNPSRNASQFRLYVPLPWNSERLRYYWHCELWEIARVRPWSLIAWTYTSKKDVRTLVFRMKGARTSATYTYRVLVSELSKGALLTSCLLSLTQANGWGVELDRSSIAFLSPENAANSDGYKYHRNRKCIPEQKWSNYYYICSVIENLKRFQVAVVSSAHLSVLGKQYACLPTLSFLNLPYVNRSWLGSNSMTTNNFVYSHSGSYFCRYIFILSLFVHLLPRHDALKRARQFH